MTAPVPTSLLVCPTCGAVLEEVGHYRMDGAMMETFHLCLSCGHEEVASAEAMALAKALVAAACPNCGHTAVSGDYECVECGWGFGFSTHSEDV